ncbi:MAG: DNA-3-methyladenine glycosylase 2 family protein [Acholeplasmataceae bacterium]|nr:DNA-3-methyladenine glycosylase 2 family protein [Acholeplasmataceae bacterium]
MKRLTYNRQSDEVRYLIKQDPKLKTLFNQLDEVHVTIDDNYFVSLVGTIVSQQLSGKVAQVIFRRVHDYFDQDITTRKVLLAPEEQLRSLGLSFQKIKYLKSLSECVISQTVKLHELDHLDDEDIIKMLTQIKGIGRWSAEMFLIFSLGRQDVYSVLDLGLRNALKRLYNNQNLSHEEINKISEKWKPYRTIVSHFLWHAWDTEKA